MPRYSQREDELAMFFLQGRHGNVLLGFYCGYSSQEVAHFLVASTIRADKNVGAKLMERIPYFAEWRALRNKSAVAWPVVPTVQDFKEGLATVTNRITTNRMSPESTDTIAGCQAITAALSQTRADGLVFEDYYNDVLRDTLALAQFCGLYVTDREGRMHGKPHNFRRLDYQKLLPEKE